MSPLPRPGSAPTSSLSATGAVRSPTLTIDVRVAIGHGPTELAAFDDALHGANIANFNLLLLSSVIPPNSVIRVLDDPSADRPTGDWGDRLYVVMAHATSSTPGEIVAAGIGWVQDPLTGRGLFVEHEVGDEQQVERDIGATLGAMVARRDEPFGPQQHRVTAAVTPDSGAVCALVVATYESESWRGSSDPDSSLN